MSAISTVARLVMRWPLVLVLLSAPAIAGMDASALRPYVGYTIVGVFTITGWRDKDGTGEDGAFKGCQFGRVVVLDNDKALTCAGYGYQYAYRPDAVVLARGGMFKMVVEGDVYDMQH
jgi:hypothetical protein